MASLQGGPDAMGFEVGFAGAKVEPMPLVGVEGSEFSLGGEIEKGGYDRDFFVGGNEVENRGADTVDAGELMGACCDAEFVADVGDLVVSHCEVRGGALGANSEGGGVGACFVGGDEVGDSDVGQDVAVVDEKGVVADEGGDVLDAASGFEEVFFVEEVKVDSAIASLGEGSLPLFVQVMGVDGDFFDSGREEVVEGMSRHGAMKDGHEGFGDRVGHGLEAGAESGSE